MRKQKKKTMETVKNETKKSNSKHKNNSSKVQFKLTRNKVWEIERVPSTEKKNLWWTKYELQRNIKKRKESRQKRQQQKQTVSDNKKVESEVLYIFTKKFYSLLDQANISAAERSQLIAEHDIQKAVIAEQLKRDAERDAEDYEAWKKEEQAKHEAWIRAEIEAERVREAEYVQRLAQQEAEHAQREAEIEVEREAERKAEAEHREAE